MYKLLYTVVTLFLINISYCGPYINAKIYHLYLICIFTVYVYFF